MMMGLTFFVLITEGIAHVPLLRSGQHSIIPEGRTLYQGGWWVRAKGAIPKETKAEKR